MTIAKKIVDFCREHDIHFAFAESCTGGRLAAAIVDVPGASDVFHGSFVAYSDGMKMEALGVDGYALGKHGAVSEIIANTMAFGALQNLRGNFGRTQPDFLPTVFAVSTTGFVGPYTDENRHAFIAICGDTFKNPIVGTHEISFKTDDRAGNQQAVVDRALQEIADMLEKHVKAE